MSGSSASWCKETDEKINYTKLCRLLVDGGTQAVRSVFDGINPPSSLKAIFNANKATLQKLKKPKGKVLNNEQWDKLYPPSGSSPKSQDFDITLLFVLLRNICGLTPPVYEITASRKRKCCWDKLPHKTENSQEANLTRIKYYRNNIIAHKSSTEINDVDFEQHWQDISSALLSLGLSQDDIDDLKSDPLGKKDYNQLLDDWYISDKDIKTQLEKVKLGTADIKSDTVLLPGIQEDISQLKSMYSSAHAKDSPINQLANSDFNSLIESLCKSFHQNTRQWVLDEVKSHILGGQSDPCEMLITAGPGMGKSTIAAKICQSYKDLGCLAGCHFFQFSNSTRNNPRLMLQSIARQMCDTVPGYQEALESNLQTDLGKKKTEMNSEELFTVLLEEPLQKIKTNEQTFVVVLDAIDECSSELKHKLQDILKNKLSLLPSWLRLVITTRPPPSFNALKAKKSILIDPTDHKNQRDIEIFFKANLEYVEDQSVVIEQLVKVSDGLFLVAFFLIDEIQKQRISSPSELKVIFPHGLSSIYEKYFERLRIVLLPYITEKEGFFRMLEAVVVSKDPIPIEMMYNILGLKSAIPGERKARSDALSQLHSLFPVENDHISAFHKSVVDFLFLEEKEQDFNIPVGKMSKKSVEKLPDEVPESLQGASEVSDSSSHVEGKRDQDKPLNTVCPDHDEPPKDHDFSVNVDDGYKVLVDQCCKVLSDILNGKKDLNKPLDLTDSETYALRLAWLPATDTSPTKKSGKCQKLRNYFTFVACICSNLFSLKAIYDVSGTSKFSDPVCDIIRWSIAFINGEHSKESCLFRTSPTFGCCIEMVLNAAYDREVSETEISPNPLALLKEHNLSYFLRESIDINSLQKELNETVVCQNGFILLLRRERNTEIHRYQLDGTCLAKKSFLGKRIIFLSPGYCFIVVIKEMEKGDIEILDATTLDLVSSFQSPNVIRSCHVYGNQPWYIVIRCYNNKIYVMEGETGQMSSAPIEVDQYVDVIAVSASGHILLGTIWESTCSRVAKALFTDEDGRFLEEMNWQFIWEPYARKDNSEYTFIKYGRLILFHSTESVKRVPIYPRKTNPCICSEQFDNLFYIDCDGVFSDDGKLLAFVYKGSIFIVETSSNLLYRQVYLGLRFEKPSKHTILFLSDRYVVINNSCTILFININTNRIEHRFLMHMYTYWNKLLVIPRKQGEPFTLLATLQSRHDHISLSKYEFHNLKL